MVQAGVVFRIPLTGKAKAFELLDAIPRNDLQGQFRAPARDVPQLSPTLRLMESSASAR
jgi:hypothetical protein